ncbi:lysylphosphatidylglycerol synthase transmembrane domain-containing protein [Actinomarinicola tropica]|nr:lysylphosphatidylglycerol synthase transmembrane domain-containing protein [Actinomarinicola tropica]
METTTTDRKRKALLVLRIVVSLAMLGVLFLQVDDVAFSEVIPPWSAGNGLWLLGAATLTFVGIGVSAARWHQVLAALGVHARWRHLFSHYLAGQFVSNVLPTTIGGDVLRVSRLSRETGLGPSTFASVVLERLSGWIVLPLITFSGLALNPGLRGLGRASTVATAIALVTLVGLMGVVIFVADKRLLGRFTSSEGWQRFVGAVHLGVDGMRRRPTDAMAVLAVGIGYQLVLVLAALMAAQALHIPQVGLTALLVFMPAVLIIQVLPIGISGLGLREGAFVLFLKPLGVPAEKAIALGLLLYLLNLVTSLPGAGAFALGNRRRAGAPGGQVPR